MNTREFFKFGDFFKYFIRVFKKQEGEKTNRNLAMMHWTNRISIVMFLFAVIVMIYRAFIR
jgi:hypothetical protein